MKNAIRMGLFFMVLWLWGTCSLAQPPNVKGIPEQNYFLFTFEPDENFEHEYHYLDTNNYKFIEFDSTGIWQIGQPAKGEWDSAFQSNFALMTDTANLIDYPIKASFTFKFERPWYSNCFTEWFLVMRQKHDLPVDKAGFYIETSYDKGETWWQLKDDSLPCWYSEADGQICNRVDFDLFLSEFTVGDFNCASGQQLEWSDDHLIAGKSMGGDYFAAQYFGVWLRFTYENLDTFPHKGWMIDDLLIVVSYNCEFLSKKEKTNSDVYFYPIPLTDQSTLEFPNVSGQECTLTILNLQGNTVTNQQTCDSYFQITRSDYQPGLYLYTIQASNGVKIASGEISN